MTIDLLAVLAILWAHFVGDFILQSDYHATNKSRSNLALFEHVLYYSLPLTFVGFLIPVSISWIVANAAACITALATIQEIPVSISWIVANAVMHAAVDYVTSRITSRLWAQGQRHWFFVTIGADQSLHFTCLFASYLLLVR